MKVNNIFKSGHSHKLEFWGKFSPPPGTFFHKLYSIKSVLEEKYTCKNEYEAALLC